MLSKENIPFTISINLKYFISATLLILLLGSCSENFQNSSNSVDNTFDFSNWNFTEKGILKLQGDCTYYWDTYLTQPEDLPSVSAQSSQFKLPGFWTLQQSEFLTEHPYGMLSVHTTILLPDTLTSYALKFRSVMSAYEVWGNGKLLSKTGKVGKTKENLLVE